jgi:hypothetical protein
MACGIEPPRDFLTFLWWRSLAAQPPRTEHLTARLNRTRCSVPQQLCLAMLLHQRILVVRNGNIDVGKKTSTRKPGQPIVQGLAGSDSAFGLRPGICRAMLQQCADSGRGNQSAPQKFVQLVGCRDPKAQSEAGIRPRPAPVKR